MDKIDISNEILQRAGWGNPLPKTSKQFLTCPSCGQMAIYMNQQLQCTDLCHHFTPQANPQHISMEQQ